MMYAEVGISAVLLVVLGSSGRAITARLRRIRRTRLPDRHAMLRLQKTHGKRSPAGTYPTGGSANSKGLRLAIERSHAKRVQRRRAKREFQAWLEITSQPL
jgi:hypothetical protein